MIQKGKEIMVPIVTTNEVTMNSKTTAKEVVNVMNTITTPEVENIIHPVPNDFDNNRGKVIEIFNGVGKDNLQQHNFRLGEKWINNRSQSQSNQTTTTEGTNEGKREDMVSGTHKRAYSTRNDRRNESIAISSIHP